jgi:hypothetical protein
LYSNWSNAAKRQVKLDIWLEKLGLEKLGSRNEEDAYRILVELFTETTVLFEVVGPSIGCYLVCGVGCSIGGFIQHNSDAVIAGLALESLALVIPLVFLHRARAVFSPQSL